ncbi:hypothetical protein [Thermithiobacillus plumbiphilus]|uniref:Uncharacterized protein n=1 Tax=Thermithiobacillus plumbiphilus TaxID=1729899 RepID=A0ABU9D7U1_9PROT
MRFSGIEVEGENVAADVLVVREARDLKKGPLRRGRRGQTLEIIDELLQVIEIQAHRDFFETFMTALMWNPSGDGGSGRTFLARAGDGRRI